MKTLKEKKKVQITIPSLSEFDDPSNDEPMKKRPKPSKTGSGLLGQYFSCYVVYVVIVEESWGKTFIRKLTKGNCGNTRQLKQSYIQIFLCSKNCCKCLKFIIFFLST